MSAAPPAAKDRSVYAMLMAEKKADVFLTYCTNAILAAQESPGLKVGQLPQALAVGAEYGMTLMTGRATVRRSYPDSYSLHTLGIRAGDAREARVFEANPLI